MKKRRKDAFLLLLALLSDQKRGKSHLRGLSSLLNISPCRLAATSANKMPRPSRYIIDTATGSKRSSADSDSLLCHVRLWRTSRFRFGCASVCEHSKIGFILIVPSAHSPYPRCPVSATPTHMLRICVNPRHALSAGVQTMRARICSAFSCDMFARVVWLKSCEVVKLPTFAPPFTARTCHAWLARLTRARGKRYIREGNALLYDFWYFWSYKSTIKEKASLCFFAGRRRRRPLQAKIQARK